jgi:hypothetical protein
MKKFLLPFICGVSLLHAQNDQSNGDWKSRYVSKEKTPECEYMIRQGDIDNLGFGWEEKFNPFSGKSTPSHSYPWVADTAEIKGYDRIMLPSSMKAGSSPCGGDGYSGEFETLKQSGSTVYGFSIPLKGLDTSKIKTVSVQLFIDDFQAPVFCSKFEATLNGKPFTALTKTLNGMNQTGPIGKLITVKVPLSLIGEFKKPEIKIMIDDKTTGAADGFAIDFIKIMVNPYKYLTGNYLGNLKDQQGNPMANAVVECGDLKTTTDANGNFRFNALVAGSNVFVVNAPGFPEKTFNVDVEENQTTMEDLIFEK